MGEVNWQIGGLQCVFEGDVIRDLKDNTFYSIGMEIWNASHSTQNPLRKHHRLSSLSSRNSIELGINKAVALNSNRIIITDPLSAAKSY